MKGVGVEGYYDNGRLILVLNRPAALRVKDLAIVSSMIPCRGSEPSESHAWVAFLGFRSRLVRLLTGRSVLLIRHTAHCFLAIWH
ncbi:hypothetical protein E2C01_041165 [Portunus trituberculatus]|uniref:Uncharacterized protein n=1 Tax=Portunus trituberculatus TaxID=210409 RepID=A0A5B7FII3_PORTR|nr:hypothetical protein [Portunus trituberculatus]